MKFCDKSAYFRSFWDSTTRKCCENIFRYNLLTKSFSMVYRYQQGTDFFLKRMKTYEITLQRKDKGKYRVPSPEGKMAKSRAK